jgi:hypothetical protein
MLHCPTGLKPQRALAAAKWYKLALTKRPHGKKMCLETTAFRTFALQRNQQKIAAKMR